MKLYLDSHMMSMAGSAIAGSMSSAGSALTSFFKDKVFPAVANQISRLPAPKVSALQAGIATGCVLLAAGLNVAYRHMRRQPKQEQESRVEPGQKEPAATRLLSKEENALLDEVVKDLNDPEEPKTVERPKPFNEAVTEALRELSARTPVANAAENNDDLPDLEEIPGNVVSEPQDDDEIPDVEDFEAYADAALEAQNRPAQIAPKAPGEEPDYEDDDGLDLGFPASPRNDDGIWYGREDVVDGEIIPDVEVDFESRANAAREVSQVEELGHDNIGCWM